MSSKLEPETTARLTAAFESINEAVVNSFNGIEQKILKSIVCCPNCWHFNKKNEECKLVDLRPPANVIAFGCPKFEQGAPF